MGTEHNATPGGSEIIICLDDLRTSAKALEQERKKKPKRGKKDKAGNDKHGAH